MAQRTVITYEDDISGGDATESIIFALDGTTFEIDLNADNAEALRAVFFDYMGKARKVSKGRTAQRKTQTTSAGSAASAAEIRIWGRENGYAVPDRGRVPAEVRAAFEAAN